MCGGETAFGGGGALVKIEHIGTLCIGEPLYRPLAISLEELLGHAEGLGRRRRVGSPLHGLGAFCMHCIARSSIQLVHVMTDKTQRALRALALSCATLPPTHQPA